MLALSLAAGPTLAQERQVRRISDGPERDVLSHTGMCEASAAVAAPGGGFVVANDGDNVFRRYAAVPDAPATAEHPFHAFLGLPPSGNRNRADLEGAAALGDRIYWVGSHSRNNESEERPARHRVFATVWDGERLVPAPGTAWASLFDELVSAGSFHPARAPDAGGMNIEGLAAGPDGTSLLIGLRAPLSERTNARPNDPQDHAFVLRLVNPAEVVGDTRPPGPDRVRARLTVLRPIDLGGRGIRSMEWLPARREYLIVAGPADPRPGRPTNFDLFRWSGSDEAQPVPLHGAAALLAELDPNSNHPFTPEALIVESDVPGAPTRIRLLSDDGDRKHGGTECQALNPKSARRFRSVVLLLHLD